jgi:iron-sulfur cluster protein
MIKTAQDMAYYKKQLAEALADQFLRTALDNFHTAYKENRAGVYAGIDFERIRDNIAAGKDAALKNLTALFAEFKTHAEAAGATVHSAENAEQANRIIAGIAKANGVNKIIKAKSMTAEEIFLNDHLEQHGFTVTETDLGEWIIQLRGEGPSHMVLPAIHLSRHQVGDLFTQVTQKKQDAENIDKLVKVARQELRSAFLEADMGISGANFAVAESGALGLVTNEGNMRLATTLPRVHVALVGYDKLIPDLKSMFNILEVLPRNATGQAITSYVTWIKGATECRGSQSNRKIFHIVFLDNGRLALAKDPVFSKALRCIRCGACANVCPVYSQVGGHRYGHVYIGAIGLILTLFYHGKKNDRIIVQNCMNCQSCKEVCPVAIDLPHLIKKTYREVLDQENKTPVKNILLSAVMKRRRLFHFILRRASLAQRPMVGKGSVIRHLPHFFAKEHGFRSLPAIAKIPFRDHWQTIRRQTDHPKYRIALFAGCAIDFIYPEQAKALLSILAAENVQVDFPMSQTCCGLPALMAAEEDTARDVAWQNMKAFFPNHYDYVLTLCASCGSHIKHNYPKIFKNYPNTFADVKRFAGKIIDFSSFMVEVLPLSSENFNKTRIPVAYHAPCHLCRGLRVIEAPRRLIELAGYTYVASKNEDVCCGFGGSYSIDFPEISAEILNKKLNWVENTRAQILATDCPGCVLQLRGGMDKRQGKIRVLHMAELVAETKNKI